MNSKQERNVSKLFKPAAWAIDNPSIIYVLIAFFLFLGLGAYYDLPLEDFPEIKETNIYVSVPYPGNSAEDIERLIIEPLEDELKTVRNVVEIVSTAQQDYGMIMVEFDEDIEVQTAKQLIKDKVDGEKASEDWPTFNGSKVEPNVFDLTLSEEVPIMNINLTGDFPVEKLNEFAEYLEERIESLPQIKEVDILGVQQKEVEVAVDVYQMMAAQVSFNDVLGAISNGNMTVSAGNLVQSGQRRTLRVIGEIENPEDLERFVVKSEGKTIYLSDVAEISFQDKERTTYARMFGEEVVMLSVKKRSGKNMIQAAEDIRAIIAEAQDQVLPANLDISISNDTSEKTLNQVDDLVNNIIFGILLVVLVLMFFLGFRNALFVGFAIPMSMFISFMVLSWLGYTLNTMILFGMIMGLGMLVDNGIVVVENVYRLMSEGIPRIQAAKQGISEIAYPIIISTATTVAAFVPLGLWPGIFGQFMIYFPITLSVVLGSSLVVAIFMNSMLVAQFMDIEEKVLTNKQLWRITAILGGFGSLILVFGGTMRGLGSLMLVTALLFWIYKYAIKKWGNAFQNNSLVRFESWYERQLGRAFKGRNMYYYVATTVVLLLASFVFFGISVGMGRTKIEFFPDNRPNQIVVYIEYPQGTDIEKTNEMTLAIEKEVYAVLNDPTYLDGDYNYMLDSAVSQVGEGAGNPQTDGGSAAEMPHRGKITASLREYKYRRGQDSELLRLKVQEALHGLFPGVAISVEKDANGPPVGYHINIELEGPDYDELIQTAERMRAFLNTRNIDGVEELKIDVNKGNPSMTVAVDREKAGALGIAVGQVGMQLRRSLFGEKAGVYKENGEDYDINVRFNESLKHNPSALFDQNIVFRDPANGQIKEVPISAVAQRKNTT